MTSPKSITPAEFFVLRAPAFPLSALNAFRDNFEVKEDILDTAEIRSSQFEEALYLATSNLHRKVYRERNRNPDLSLAVARYAYRMATRCTPFGTFAGVGLGSIGDVWDFKIHPPATWKRLARIDQAIVAKLQSDLLEGDIDPELLERVAVELNSSLWKAYDGYRYAEAIRGGAWTHYELSRIASTGALDAVVDILKVGATSSLDLGKQLCVVLGAELPDAMKFIGSLVQSQLLLCRPRLPVTGVDVVSTFVDNLIPISENVPSITSLSEAHKELLRVSDSDNLPLDVYERTVTHLADIDKKVDPSKAIQVDLDMGEQGLSITHEFVDQICEDLRRLSPLLSKPHTELSGFVVEFESRYGDAVVPLLELLDDDYGMGFGGSSKVQTPLLDRIPLGGARGNQKVDLRSFDAFFLGRIQQAMLAGDREIRLTDAELDKFPETSDAIFPSSASVLGSVLADTDGNRSFALSGVFGPPSGLLLGRFCCGNSALTSAVSDFIRKHETSTDIIIAELAHLPDGRVGNVILRPVLRSNEITYLGTSGAEEKDIIPASDIDVFCRNGHVYLWSRSRDIRILPRITNAHNLNNAFNLPVYRFFGAVQRQGEPFFGWGWGPIIDTLPFVPAVRFNRTLLSPARWRLYGDDTKRVSAGGEAEIGGLLADRRMPDLFRVKQADNFLELNMQFKLDRRLFVDECRRRPILECEGVPDGGDVLQSDNGARYRNEVVIPMTGSRRASTVAEGPKSRRDRTAFSPGSEWLYARIFCGPSVADRWIADRYRSWSELCLSAGCETPFFIRYGTGGSHLRVRVKGPAEYIWNGARSELEASLASLVDARAVSHVEYATYFPELARYRGAEMTTACERVFSLDSAAAAALIAALPTGASREEERWKSAFVGIFSLLRSFNLPGEAEAAVVQRMRDGYAAEFSVGSTGRTALNDKYRKHKSFLDSSVTAVEAGVTDEALKARTAGIADMIKSGELRTEELPLIMDSILHMAANRVFPERARAHEAAIFHLMAKAMESTEARARHARQAAVRKEEARIT